MTFPTRLLGTAIFSLALVSCGGGGGGGGGSDSGTAKTGHFYPVTSGLAYRTATQRGTVGSDGSFKYRDGEQVTLSLAGTDLITMPAGASTPSIDLDDDTSATNALRLYKTFDTNHTLADGAQFERLASANPIVVDMASAASVQAFAQQVAIGTVLVAADADVSSALANARAEALADGQPATGEFVYVARYTGSALCADSLPASAGATFTGAPDWVGGTLTGTLAVAGNTYDITTTAGMAGGYTYQLRPIYGHAERVITVTLTDSGSGCAELVYLRNEHVANIAPLAGARVEFAPALTADSLETWNFATTMDGPFISQGSKDPDGHVVSVAWSSSSGKTGTALTFTDTVAAGQQIDVTLTVTDDEGATSTRTWKLSRKPLTLAQALTLLGTKIWKDSATYSDGAGSTYAYYYRATDESQSTVAEYEVNITDGTCSMSTFAADDVTGDVNLAKLSFYGPGKFTYSDPAGVGIYTFTQSSSLPGACP